MKILVVSAHPDDEVIGMGGTLGKLSKNHDTEVLFLADGITARKSGGHKNIPKYETTKKNLNQMKKEIENRKKHAKKALSILGIKKMKFLDLPDNELDTVPFLKIVKSVEKEILDSKCEIVFTHHYNDLNIDHRLAYEATITAARPLPNFPVKSIISFEALSSSDWRQPYSFKPNMFVDISNQLKLKLKSIKNYKNEIRKYPHPRSLETIEAVSKRWGSLYGFKAAEAFEIVFTRGGNLNNFLLN